MQRALGQPFLWGHISFQPIPEREVRAVSWWFRCNLHHRHGASLFSRNYFIPPDSRNISVFAPGSLLQSCTSNNCVLNAFKESCLIERVHCAGSFFKETNYFIITSWALIFHSSVSGLLNVYPS